MAKTFRLKYRFKISCVVDGKSKVFRFNDEKAFLVFIRMREYTAAGEITLHEHPTTKERVVEIVLYKNHKEFAFVVDRSGTDFLSNLPNILYRHWNRDINWHGMTVNNKVRKYEWRP